MILGLAYPGMTDVPPSGDQIFYYGQVDVVLAQDAVDVDVVDVVTVDAVESDGVTVAVVDTVAVVVTVDDITVETCR